MKDGINLIIRILSRPFDSLAVISETGKWANRYRLYSSREARAEGKCWGWLRLLIKYHAWVLRMMLRLRKMALLMPGIWRNG